MDFSIPAKTSDLVARIRAFVEEEIYPLEDSWQKLPFRELIPQLEDKRQRVREEGLWTPQIPRSHGGLGLGFLEHALVSEQLARSPLGHYIFNAQAPDAGNMEILLEFGTPAQQEKWLTPLLAGDVRSCFSMTAPARPGSNPVWMETRAERDGEEYVILSEDDVLGILE